MEVGLPDIYRPSTYDAQGLVNLAFKRSCSAEKTSMHLARILHSTMPPTFILIETGGPHKVMEHRFDGNRHATTVEDALRFIIRVHTLQQLCCSPRSARCFA